MADIKDINIINQVIENYFNKNPNTSSIQAKKLMPHFIDAGIFKKDHRAGLPIRELLRELDKKGELILIPSVRAERKKVNTFWYFDKVSFSNSDSNNIAFKTQNYSSTFENWITENHSQITKPSKYVGAVRTISNDLKALSEVSDLFEIINISLLKRLRNLYLGTPELNRKNTKGNRMYSRAFDLYIDFASSNDISRDILQIANTDSKDTKKEALIQARLGQGKYRNELIKIWKGCAISGYRDTSLLVASHIKPWSHSNDSEKLDPYNGFLLLPNYDKLFDKGLISFDENGCIIISDQLKNYEILGINSNIKIDLKTENIVYLEYHRNVVFRCQTSVSKKQ